MDMRLTESAGIVSRVGNTPLFRVRLYEYEHPDVEVYAKAEWFNPGGSVKDRAALSMIEDGERTGALTHQKTIIDSTSGNTGVAYALLGAAKGYRVKLVMPKNVSAERKALVTAYGAEIVFSDPGEGSDGAIRMVRDIVAADPDRYFYPDQYSNPANPRAHYEGTAGEILQQTSGRITHFVAGLGTTGTFVGTATRLKEHDSSIKTIAVQPADAFHGLEGLKHLPTAIVPRIWKPAVADEVWGAPTEAAYDLARAVAASEGLLVGHSSGAALWAVGKLAQSIRKGVVVTVFPDSGDRYMSTGLYGQKRLRMARSALEAIQRHGAEGYPYEICGLLIGRPRDSLVTEVRPVRNVEREQPQVRYLVDDREDMKIRKEYYGTELDVLGYYHSHPDHPAYPSVFDTQRSWQGYVYVIASVQGGTPRDVNAFVALKDHGPMIREQLEIV